MPSTQYYQTLLQIVQTDPHIKKLMNDETYPFQKALGSYQAFKSYPEDRNKLINLLKLTKIPPFHFEGLLHTYGHTTYEYPLLKIIGELFSYIDQYAAMKNKLNAYKDKRTMANTQIRQNHWVQQLLNYKLNDQRDDLSLNIRNVVDYLEHPDRSLQVFSENVKTAMARKIFAVSSDQLFTCMEQLNLPIKNPLNKGCVYKEILYADAVKQIWNQTGVVKENGQTMIQTPKKRKSSSEAVHYWWLNANPKIWNFESIDVGKEISYTALSSSGHKRRIYQNFLEVRAGDRVVGYEATPVKAIVALGEISQSFDGKVIKFRKTENLPLSINFAVLKGIPELSHMEFLKNMNGSLFKLTKQEYDTIIDLIRDENPIHRLVTDPYSKSDFLSEVFIDKIAYDTLTGLLERKRNLILEGAPGVGKTYVAKRLAYAMMGEKDNERVQMVQFHQSYTYEDFIIGYRPDPDGDGFKLQKGIFYNFCEKAKNHPDQKFFFIIDEINRGNLSKIFGELLMLIESDKRGEQLTLAYTSTPFSVPENLYLIGMMNTADRSLALIDYALRRRFCFYELRPAFGNSAFRSYLTKSGVVDSLADRIIDRMKTLNERISADPDLGRGFQIGHSYFCNCRGAGNQWYEDIVRYEIAPQLREYWFDEPEKAENSIEELLR